MTRIQRFPIQLRFGDEDSYGHVNNVRFLQYLEDARVQFIHHPLSDSAPDGAAEQDTLLDLIGPDHFTLVARHEIEYSAPLNYRPDPLEISIWVTGVGGSSFDLGYQIAEPDGSASYALAASTMILVNRATGRPAKLNDAQRAALEHWLGEPVSFRRRSNG
ncbi:thioesterase family protein [Arthrobacter sp. CAN_C5]|uniref:acyl-CoA thioesterase n=1 Tax=Arthrobacter sp. CAN_C5 TaxID=2760706 RepID=UPI001AE46EE7|nr:thioesterase family protein [Arthrobacter sp. CAN_C5]MBP2216424.1 acyl-CoA thioester hydrolase [Arthrobacter sp. CAN_C5]